METILANAAKELPSVVVFFLLVVFVLNWITKYTNKRDEQWQNFLGGAEEVRGKREEDWRNFLESQQQAAATLSQEYHNQTTSAMTEMTNSLKVLAGEQKRFGELLVEHDKKLDLAVTEMRSRVKDRV